MNSSLVLFILGSLGFIFIFPFVVASVIKTLGILDGICGGLNESYFANKNVKYTPALLFILYIIICTGTAFLFATQEITCIVVLGINVLIWFISLTTVVILVWFFFPMTSYFFWGTLLPIHVKNIRNHLGLKRACDAFVFGNIRGLFFIVFLTFLSLGFIDYVKYVYNIKIYVYAYGASLPVYFLLFMFLCFIMTIKILIWVSNALIPWRCLIYTNIITAKIFLVQHLQTHYCSETKENNVSIAGSSLSKIPAPVSFLLGNTTLDKHLLYALNMGTIYRALLTSIFFILVAFLASLGLAAIIAVLVKMVRESICFDPISFYNTYLALISDIRYSIFQFLSPGIEVPTANQRFWAALIELYNREKLTRLLTFTFNILKYGGLKGAVLAEVQHGLTTLAKGQEENEELTSSLFEVTLCVVTMAFALYISYKNPPYIIITD